MGSELWSDTGTGSFTDEKLYVVQTGTKAVQRCILMTTDPGDLVLDPTCGSGTTAYVAEQWGRRWITIDTSRVALALARARIMGARYPYHLLSDSREGQLKQAEVERRAPPESPTYGDIRQGFVYERVPHIHAQGHRQQHGDRRCLGGRPEGSRTPPRRAQPRAWRVVERMGDPPRCG